MKDSFELQRVVKISQGFSYIRSLDADGPSYRILQVANLQGLTVTALEDDRTEQLDVRKALPFVVRPGQVLVALRTSSLKAAVVPEVLDRAVAANSLTILDPDPTLVTPKFLAVLFNSEAMQRHVAPFYAGTTIPTLPLPDFRRLRITLPSLEDQQVLVQAQLDLNDQQAAFQHLTALHTQEINAYLSPLLTSAGSL